jgi:hypothetical protein
MNAAFSLLRKAARYAANNPDKVAELVQTGIETGKKLWNIGKRLFSATGSSARSNTPSKFQKTRPGGTSARRGARPPVQTHPIQGPPGAFNRPPGGIV